MNRIKVALILENLASDIIAAGGSQTTADALSGAARMCRVTPRWRKSRFKPNKSGEFLVVVRNYRDIAYYDKESDWWRGMHGQLDQQPSMWCPLPDMPNEN